MPLILFNKPWGVLSQFTDTRGRPTLAQFINHEGVYPAGRLDRDSEGLLLLTSDGALQARIADPKYKLVKRYLVQVEGQADSSHIVQLKNGVELKEGPARILGGQPVKKPRWLWERNPPVRYRRTVPSSWLELEVQQGRNRMIRRITAAVGLPTLRLVRIAVGPWHLEDMQPGETRIVADQRAWSRLAG